MKSGREFLLNIFTNNLNNTYIYFIEMKVFKMKICKMFFFFLNITITVCNKIEFIKFLNGNCVFTRFFQVIFKVYMTCLHLQLVTS